MKSHENPIVAPLRGTAPEADLSQQLQRIDTRMGGAAVGNDGSSWLIMVNDN